MMRGSSLCALWCWGIVEGKAYGGAQTDEPVLIRSAQSCQTELRPRPGSWKEIETEGKRRREFVLRVETRHQPYNLFF